MSAIALAAWLPALVGDLAAALPASAAHPIWLAVGWGMVLASAVLFLTRKIPFKWRFALALVGLLTCWLPGPASPAYWLGLAFQAPSVATVWLCGLYVWRAWAVGVGRSLPAHGCTPASAYASRGLCVATLLIGCLLLLDTFAVFPWQLYAWGFHPASSAVLLFVGVMPWVMAPKAWCQSPMLWTPVISVLLFVALRLPSGNAWDAVLDPWLWLVVLGVTLRGGWRLNVRRTSEQPG